jgi:hypothetical protein
MRKSISLRKKHACKKLVRFNRAPMPGVGKLAMLGPLQNPLQNKSEWVCKVCTRNPQASKINPQAIRPYEDRGRFNVRARSAANPEQISASGSHPGVRLWGRQLACCWLLVCVALKRLRLPVHVAYCSAQEMSGTAAPPGATGGQPPALPLSD